MKALKIAIPHLFHVVNIVVIHMVGDDKREFTREVAFLYSHLPVVLVVLVDIPFQTDVMVFLCSDHLGGSHVLLCPRLAPLECEYSILFLNIVSQPFRQAVGVSYQVPHDAM